MKMPKNTKFPIVVHSHLYAWISLGSWVLMCYALWQRHPSIGAYFGSFFHGRWLSIFESWAGILIPTFGLIFFMRTYRISSDKAVLKYFPKLPFQKEFPLADLKSVELRERRNSSLDLVLIFRQGAIKIPAFFCGYKDLLSFLMEEHPDKIIH